MGTNQRQAPIPAIPDGLATAPAPWRSGTQPHGPRIVIYVQHEMPDILWPLSFVTLANSLNVVFRFLRQLTHKAANLY